MKAIQSLGRFVALFLALSVASTAQAKPDFIVDSTWLEENFDRDDVVVMEVRYHPHRYFTVGHIPGAVQVQRFKDLGDNDGNPLMRFPSRDAFQSRLRDWGVNDDTTVVIYDDSLTALASRLYYLLELYGFDMSRVKVMEGGTTEWELFNDLSKEAETHEPGDVTLSEADDALYVEWTDVYDDVVSRRDEDVVLLDARPEDMYTGEVIQQSVRGGHIPGAINVVSLDGADGGSQKWKSTEALEAMYDEIPKDKTVYVYCHDGFRMSLAYMQLKALGYEDVRLYNGGWSHWGNALTLPVVEGDEPYDEDYAL